MAVTSTWERESQLLGVQIPAGTPGVAPKYGALHLKPNTSAGPQEQTNLLMAPSNTLLGLAKRCVRVQSQEEGWGLLQAGSPDTSGAPGSQGAPHLQQCPEGHGHCKDTAAVRTSTSATGQLPTQACFQAAGKGALFHSASASPGTEDCPRDAALCGNSKQGTVSASNLPSIK